MTLAILADDQPNWRPTHYESIVCRQAVIHFQFLINKLLDYEGQEDALLAHSNPFALIVATQLAAIARRSDPQARLVCKTNLTRKLSQKGLDKKAIIALFRFIDGVLSLPEALENT